MADDDANFGTFHGDKKYFPQKWEEKRAAAFEKVCSLMIIFFLALSASNPAQTVTLFSRVKEPPHLSDPVPF